MTTTLLIAIIFLNILIVVLFFVFRPKKNDDFLKLIFKVGELQTELQKLENGLKEDFRINREESGRLNKENREELGAKFLEFSNQLISQLDKNFTQVQERMKEVADRTKADNLQIREEVRKEIREFQDAFDKNVKSFNELQREKFGQLTEELRQKFNNLEEKLKERLRLVENQQKELVETTEKKLEQMRNTVDEKLQKTLNERLSQSFETVGKQLQAVQEGLGEMKNLAQDVGGLKKVLSNVKIRGGIGEVQLSMLLEQMLAPEQYDANVVTKKGSSERVEFAIRLPGKEENQNVVYLPIDAKFPKETYEHLIDAFETGDPATIEIANRNMENVIKKMAKDIRDKYIDPPNTTDFAIMFLPFEAIYAEVIRRSALFDQLHHEFKIIVTGPTTLAAILNSLQMGFRTLVIQKRSSEVWNILSAVKTEFAKFGGMLDRAHKQITTAGQTIEQLKGTRTNAINRKLRDVMALPNDESAEVFPELESADIDDEFEIEG
jgi:DNA recombination protein RmuC